MKGPQAALPVIMRTGEGEWLKCPRKRARRHPIHIAKKDLKIPGEFTAASVFSVRQRPADHGHRQHQQQHPRADNTQGSPVA